MAAASRGRNERAQVNVPLEDEHWHLALMQLAIRDEKTVPELLRPVIVGYLKRKVAADPDLAQAVEKLEKSRQHARRSKRTGAEVTELPQRPNLSRRRGRTPAARRPTAG